MTTKIDPSLSPAELEKKRAAKAEEMRRYRKRKKTGERGVGGRERTVIVHGEPTGARKHRDRGEPVCEACAKSWVKYVMSFQKKKAEADRAAAAPAPTTKISTGRYDYKGKLIKADQ